MIYAMVGAESAQMQQTAVYTLQSTKCVDAELQAVAFYI
jgi:hypothetical protein